MLRQQVACLACALVSRQPAALGLSDSPNLPKLCPNPSSCLKLTLGCIRKHRGRRRTHVCSEGGNRIARYLRSARRESTFSSYPPFNTHGSGEMGLPQKEGLIQNPPVSFYDSREGTPIRSHKPFADGNERLMSDPHNVRILHVCQHARRSRLHATFCSQPWPLA